TVYAEIVRTPETAEKNLASGRSNKNLGGWAPEWEKIFGQGMQRFHANPPRRVTFTEEEIQGKDYRNLDRSASVVRVYSRLLADRGWQPTPGISHFWIYRNEVQSLLDIKPSEDGIVLLPPTMLARLIRCHLTDHQAGAGLSWNPEEILKCDFTARLSRS